MKQYLSLATLCFMGLLSIYFYYIYYPFHGEDKSFFFLYFVIVSIAYGIYKMMWALLISQTTQISASRLIVIFLIHLFILSTCFFAFNGANASFWTVLFFKIGILFFSVLTLWINFYCFWYGILRHLKFLNIQEKSARILASLWLGFSAFMLGVFILALFGFYSFWPIILLCICTAIIWYSAWTEILKNLKTPIKKYSHNLSSKASFSEKYNIGLIIDELHYIVITFLISINLVSVYRPFPIGWDDLWAYMNYPKLLSQAGEHIALWKMYLWEMYTGIWFLSGSQTLAFYLNSFSGIVAAFVIYLWISYFLKDRKTTFDFALFSSIIVIMMPMVVFQIAKDMKLDLWLLSMSVISLGVFYAVIFSKQENKVWVYALLWILIGTAFAIKVTSLLLLLWILGALFYKRFSLAGFISFLFVFIGIFSYLNLWKVMNIVIPWDSENMKAFSSVAILLWFGIFITHVLFCKYKFSCIKNFSMELWALLLWFIAILLPWGYKNISEIPTDAPKATPAIVSGYADAFRPDYKAIRTIEEIQAIEDSYERISEKGNTSNEDFWRYFWYEWWINNYLKLPWNLSFQTNQKGEFTDITYIFLALLPALFLFLPYRKQVYKYPIVISMLLALLYFIPSPISSYIGNIFSLITLPGGYIIIGSIFLLPLAYLHIALDKNKNISQLFLVNLAFTTIYLWLWAVSSFGIVWYGIVMYFSLLVMIILCMSSGESTENKNPQTGTYVVLLIVWVYILGSSIPHGITNLKTAWYSDYKLWGVSEEVALMSYHPEYFTILAETNISPEFRQDFFSWYRNKVLEVLDDTPYSENLVPQIQSITNLAQLHGVIVQLSSLELWDEKYNTQLTDIRQSLYEDIVYVWEDIKNTGKIYRVGTFMKYFISENNIRILEDSLLAQFQDYIYDTDTNITLERLKKIWVDYLLLDINAATIDKDPQRGLTQRYENMLNFVKNPSVQLIESDSVCLKVAIDTYKIDNNLENYRRVAWVNYNYRESSTAKRLFCIEQIISIIQNPERLQQYPYLMRYKTALEESGIDINDTQASKNALSRVVSGWYKALFKIQ